LAARLSVRPGEVRAADIGDFRVDGEGRPWLTLAHAMKGPNSSARPGGPKQRKIASIPLDDAAVEWIRWRIEQRAAAMARGGPAWLLSMALFPNPTGRRTQHRWLSNALRLEWNRARERAGVKINVKMYEGTKHSFATDAVARGIPMEWVQKFLRHADRRSTERYARLANAGLLAVLPPKKR
jgi:site-specific recombinase XerD